MSFSLVDLVMRAFTPELVGKIAGSLGIKPALAQHAVAILVPMIVGCMAKAAVTPDGAAHITAVLATHEQGPFGKIGWIPGGPGSSPAQDYGSRLAGQLLGAAGRNEVIGAATAAGLSVPESQTLLGLLTPIVAGSVAHYQTDASLDADGLARLLAEPEAMPLGSMPGVAAAPAGRNITVATVVAAPEVESARLQQPAASAGRVARTALAILLVLLAGWWLKIRFDISQQLALESRARAAAASAAATADHDAARRLASEAEARRKVVAEMAAAKLAADAEAARSAEAVKRASEADAQRRADTVAAGTRAKAVADAAAIQAAADRSKEAERAAKRDAEVHARNEIAACQQAVAATSDANAFQFGFKSATVTAESATVLQQLALAIKACPATRLRIEGHTDNNGDAERNQHLSENRAKSVMDYLAAVGVEPTRMTAVGYGQSKPRVPNDTDAHRLQNRRIEVVVVPN